MNTEQTTLLVSINVEDNDGEEGRLNKIGQQVGDGWRVIQAIPLSGEEASPGGLSENYMRFQVTVERDVDTQNMAGDGDRTGASDLSNVGQVSAAFDKPLRKAAD